MPTENSPLHRLFVRQQPKVKATPRKAALLKTFANDNNAMLAKLIQKWLEEDERNQAKPLKLPTNGRRT